MKNLLLTMKGERVSQPEFGSNLGTILFNRLDGSSDGFLSVINK